MNQPLWMPKRRIEVAFRRALLDIAKGIVMRVGETSDPQLIGATLEHLAKTQDFIRLSEAIAMKMVTGLFDDTARTWREAARNNGRGREIYQAIQKELQGHVGREYGHLCSRTQILSARCQRTSPLTWRPTLIERR